MYGANITHFAWSHFAFVDRLLMYGNEIQGVVDRADAINWRPKNHIADRSKNINSHVRCKSSIYCEHLGSILNCSANPDNNVCTSIFYLIP